MLNQFLFPLLRSLKSELFKMKKGKFLYICAAIAAAMPILTHVLLTLLIKPQLAATAVKDPSAASDMAQFMAMTASDFISSAATEFLKGGSGLIMALVLAVVLFGEDRFNGTLKYRVMASGRLPVIIAKMVTAIFTLLAIVAVNAISASLVALLFYKGGVQSTQFIEIAVKYILTFHALIAYTYMMMGLCMAVGKVSGAFGWGIGIYFIYSIMAQLLPQSIQWLVPYGYILRIGDIYSEVGSQMALNSVITVGIYLLASIIGLTVSMKKQALSH